MTARIGSSIWAPDLYWISELHLGIGFGFPEMGARTRSPNCEPGVETQIWEPDLGAKLGGLIWDPEFGPRIGHQVWTPDLGPRFGVQIWKPRLAARLVCMVWASGLGTRFGGQVGEAGLRAVCVWRGVL